MTYLRKRAFKSSSFVAFMLRHYIDVFKIAVSLGIAVLTLSGCKKNPCEGVIAYAKLYPTIPTYFYKVGSYWVYEDSATSTIDSQCVYQYSQLTHYRDPIDTPDKYYWQISPGGARSDVYCGPYYLDDIKMRIASYKNGSPADTFTIHGAGTQSSNASISIWSHETYQSSASVVGIFLDWQKIGFLNCCYSLTNTGMGYDTTGEWYRGKLDNYTSGPYSFDNIQVWTIQITNGTSAYFAYKTDLYLTARQGIVRIVQHKPGGDVVWKLIHYKIVQ